MLFTKKKEQPQEEFSRKTSEEMEQKQENTIVIEVLKNIKDPELNVDLWTLKLIYDIHIEGKKLDIFMTFTSPMCPYGPFLLQQVQEQLEKKGFQKVHV